MTDQQGARDSGPTPEEAASVGTADRDDIQAETPLQEPERSVRHDFVDETVHAEPRSEELKDQELQAITMRWRDIQARFVDEPRAAVRDADALVADLMQRLTRMLAAERHQLESRSTNGEDISTEDLRQGLLRYRAVFDRLLAATGGTNARR
jgi:hypothetical protein